MIVNVAPNQTRLIFVRHGESIGNYYETFLGHTNFDLTDKGFRQAESACAYIYTHYKVDKIYSSDLARAYHTVLPLARALSLDITKNRGLREIDAGYWECMRFSDIAIRYPEDYSNWKSRIGQATCTGGESVAHLRNRIVCATEEIIRNEKGKTICIGTHATPIRMMNSVWKGLPIEKAHEAEWPHNASVTVVVYEADGSCRVELYGEDSFLGEDRTRILFK